MQSVAAFFCAIALLEGVEEIAMHEGASIRAVRYACAPHCSNRSSLIHKWQLQLPPNMTSMAEGSATC